MSTFTFSCSERSWGLDCTWLLYDSENFYHRLTIPGKVGYHTFPDYRLCLSLNVHQRVILQLIARDWVLSLHDTEHFDHWLSDQWGENCTHYNTFFDSKFIFFSPFTIMYRFTWEVLDWVLSLPDSCYFDHCLTVHTGHGTLIQQLPHFLRYY